MLSDAPMPIYMFQVILSSTGEMLEGKLFKITTGSAVGLNCNLLYLSADILFKILKYLHHAFCPGIIVLCERESVACIYHVLRGTTFNFVTVNILAFPCILRYTTSIPLITQVNHNIRFK